VPAEIDGQAIHSSANQDHEIRKETNMSPANPQFILATWAGLALALAPAPASAADVVINAFDTASEVGQWRFDFGGATHTAVFDPSQDGGGNPASGSMQITLGFNTALGGENKAAYTRDLFPGLNGTTFSGMSMDVRVDPGSAVDAFGNNGYFQLVIRNTGNYDYNTQFGDNARSADGWRHISVAPLNGAVNDIRGITWQLYGGPAQNLPGPVTLWIDNVAFTQVPEPGTTALASLGILAALGHVIRQRHKRAGRSRLTAC
jgi:hypothetical protein